jgi:hypothetical protein
VKREKKRQQGRENEWKKRKRESKKKVNKIQREAIA